MWWRILRVSLWRSGRLSRSWWAVMLMVAVAETAGFLMGLPYWLTNQVEGYLVGASCQVGPGYFLVSPLVVSYSHVGVIYEEGAMIHDDNWIQMTWKCGTVRGSPRNYLLSAGAILEVFTEGGADCRLAVADVEVSLLTATRFLSSKFRILFLFWCWTA